jgi:hypothetical protein
MAETTTDAGSWRATFAAYVISLVATVGLIILAPQATIGVLPIGGLFIVSFGIMRIGQLRRDNSGTLAQRDSKATRAGPPTR